MFLLSLRRSAEVQAAGARGVKPRTHEGERRVAGNGQPVARTYRRGYGSRDAGGMIQTARSCEVAARHVLV
jgi:hypothetical protein